MKTSAYASVTVLLAAAVTCASLESVSAVDLFGKRRNNPEAIAPERISGDEASAQTLFNQAQSLPSSKALSVYRSIVKQYPYTKTAAEAQFKVAQIREAEGGGRKAFDEYQAFIDSYKGSQHFSEAVNRQFTIAKGLMETQGKGFLGMGGSVQPSKLIEMFKSIRNNAPRNEALAAASLFNVGVIYRRDGKDVEAIDTFQSVVDEFARSSFAADAQFQIIEINSAIAANSRNPANLRQYEESINDFMIQFPKDPRVADVKGRIGKLDDTDTENKFNIGRFYERKGELAAAAVYYYEVTQRPGSARHADAKERLDKILQADPSISVDGRRRPVASAAAGGSGNNAPSGGRRPAAPSVKERASFLGPPPPSLKEQKPAMRTSADDVVPIPNEDPVAQR